MSSESEFRSSYRVCIIGAGIVGLAGALFLRRAGFQVTVLERDTTLRTAGAGIQMHPNAVRVLKDLGVDQKIRARSVLPESIILKAYKTGQDLTTQDLTGIEEKYGVPFITIHRGHLRETLYAEVLAQGVQVRHGINVDLASIDLEKGTLNVSGTDEIIQADLFLGADGGKSIVRQALIGHPEMVPHGKIVNRFLVDYETLQKSPRLRHLVDNPRCVVWLGPECQAVTYGLDGLFNIAFTWPWSKKPEDVFLKWQTVDMEDFKAKIADWEPDLRELIDISRDGLRWMLFEPKVNDEKTPWISDSGKFCLIGDAAHQTLPYLAQGSAIGLESISTLACLISKAENADQVKESLKIYQTLRKERTGHINRATLKQGHYAQMADGPLQEERDRELLHDTPTVGCPNLLADPFFQNWLWGYDPVEVAESAWKKYVTT